MQPGRVNQPLPLARNLEGAGGARRAAQLRARLGPTQPRPRLPAVLAWLGRRLLLAYWFACLTVIALGLDRLFPEVRASLAAPGAEVSAPQSFAPEPTATSEPVLHAAAPPLASRPFPTCGAAIRAGVYNIPANDPAYTPDQDGDGDGVACEVH